jgi:hypothetical protein
VLTEATMDMFLWGYRHTGTHEHNVGDTRSSLATTDTVYPAT